MTVQKITVTEKMVFDVIRTRTAERTKALWRCEFDCMQKALVTALTTAGYEVEVTK